MKGIILSGGKGSRLAPITDDFPKQLVPVLGKPILFHCIDYLTNSNINEIGIVVSHETGSIIEEAIADSDIDANIKFIYQDEPRGLAHAIGITQDFTKGDDFVVLLGDNLFDKKLDEMIQNFYDTDATSSIMLKDVDRPYAFGVVQFDPQTARAQKLVEKPKTFVSKYAIVGVYLFKKEIFEAIGKLEPSARGELEITDALAAQVDLGHNVQTSLLDSYWFDSGTREGLLNANKTMLIHAQKFDNLAEIIKDSYLLGNVNVGKGSVIKNSNLMGPIYIGKNVTIQDSVIGPFTCIGDNCRIINGEVQEGIIMENTLVEDSKIISSLVFKDLEIRKEQTILNKLFRPALVSV